MKKIFSTALALALMVGSGSAFAQGHDQGHDDHNKAPAMSMHGPAMAGPGMAMHGPSHPDWHQGGKIARDDWGRGVHVDYRAHHLKRPPRGYEWRQVDGNFVLAAAATGLIASIILASH